MNASQRTVGHAVEREILWRGFRRDPKIFMEAAWKIRVPRKRPEVIKLWTPQQQVIDWYEEGHDRYVSLKARQLGWTTITTAWAFYTGFFNEFTPWLFISHNEDYAKKNLGFVKFGYANLPEWVKERGPELKGNTTEIMEWDNGSRIESIPATGSSGRGDAVFGVMWDETAFAPNPDEQFAAIEPLVYGPLIMLSTANGYGNLFEQTYMDSKKPGSVWKSMFIPWSGRPDRDQEWYDRKARQARAKGQEWILHQEYPRNDMEAFAKSGRNPIEYELIERQIWEEPSKRLYWDGAEFVEFEEYDPDHPCILDIWEEPTVERDEEFGYALRQPNYVLFADIAEGLAHGDASAVAIYNANTRECAASLQTRMPAEMMPEIIDWLGRFYYMALVAVERNKDGWGILHYINTVLHYPRLYTMPRLANRKGGHVDSLGWHTNVSTKPKMVRDFARALRESDIMPLDPKLRAELMTFVQHENGSYGASAGNNDDMVIAHMGALQVMDDAGRFPVVYQDRKNRPMTMAELDEAAFGAPQRGIRRIGQQPAATPSRTITVVRR